MTSRPIGRPRGPVKVDRTLRLPPELDADMEAEARGLGCSVSAVAECWLRLRDAAEELAEELAADGAVREGDIPSLAAHRGGLREAADRLRALVEREPV